MMQLNQDDWYLTVTVFFALTQIDKLKKIFPSEIIKIKEPVMQ